MTKFFILSISFVFSFSIWIAPHDAWALGIRPPREVPRDPVSPTPTPTPSPRPPASGDFNALWNGQNSGAAQWTQIVKDAVTRYGDDLLKGPSDVADFCPMYDRLGTQDRLNFWVQLIAAMTKFESSFKPGMRFTESTMGIDPVTKVQVVSEGLLQLSYQDELNYRSVLPSGVCDFDFNSDRNLALTDLRRSILDPKKNLTCGVGILNRQIERVGKLAVASGAYWAVIKTNNRHNKLAEIRSITKNLSFCK